MSRWLWSRLCLSLAVAGGLLASPGLAAPTGDASFDRTFAAERALISTSPADSLRHSATLLARARRLDGSRRAIGVAAVEWLRAEALLRVNRGAEAVTAANRGIAIVQAIAPNTKLHGDLLAARGTASAYAGKIQQSLGDFQQAFRVAGRAQDRRGQARALLGIGQIYGDAGDYESAARYEQQAIETYSDTSSLLAAHNNRGMAFFELGRTREAQAEFRLALKAARTLGSPLLETLILPNLARAQLYAGDYPAAEATLARAFALTKDGPAASATPALYALSADLALRRHQLDRAAVLIERALAGARSAEATLPLIDFHRTAYDIYRRRGDQAKALIHLEAFKRLDDERRSLVASNTAALMSANFDFARQRSQISELQRSEAESRAAGAQAQARYLLVLLLGAASISALLLVGFLAIRRSRNQVRVANADLKVSNTQLEKALAAKTEFLATTSHEIRTPLNGILGMTQVILADRSVPPSLRSRVELVHGAGETMRALVDDILDVAKMETGELRIHPAEMDLKRLLEEAGQVWAGQAQTKKLAIELDIADAPPAIVADEVRLRQVVFNLMSNAIKFTDRGAVRLRAAAKPAPDGAGERLVIRIEDSGIGIPADRLEDIFESFRQVDGGTTRRHGGTGLGLAICRSLARAMGGDIRVESVLGAGSSFIVDLPLTRAEAPAAPATARRETAERLADAELLLLEANPLSQGIMRALLAPHVARLQMVGDPAEALAIVERGETDHLLADGGSLQLDLDQARNLALAARAAGARVTFLWPAPAADVARALDEWGAHLIAKPISAPDLLSGLQMVYQDPEASRDVAA